MYCQGLRKSGEACSKLATDGEFCKFHTEQNKVKDFHEQRNKRIRECWDEVMREVQANKPSASLSQIFDYLEYICSQKSLPVSRDFVLQWYKTNLNSEGHPTEIVSNPRNLSLFSRYPYLKILEKGFPKEKWEIIEEFLVKNPSATAYDISESSDLEVDEIYQIAYSRELPISRIKDNETRIMNELNKNPNFTDKELMKILGLNKFELDKIVTRLGLTLAKEKKIVVHHSDGDELRIRKNLNYLDELLTNLRSINALTPKQEELLITLFWKDGNIEATANSLKIYDTTWNKGSSRINDRLATISKQSSKLRNIIEKIKLGNHLFHTETTDYVSEVHEPSFDEIHDDHSFEREEEQNYKESTPFVRATDLAKIAKFVAFDYLRKYGYRHLPRAEFVYLVRQEFPEIFTFYYKVYGKEHLDNVQFFRPRRPPKYSIDFIREHYTALANSKIEFDMFAQKFLFECLTKLKTEMYADSVDKRFNPRETGIYKDQFIVAEGYIMEKIQILSDRIVEKYFCSECGFYGNKTKFTVKKTIGSACMACKGDPSFLKTRMLSLDINAFCPECKTEAKGLKEIEEKFGFRKVRGKTIPQSWCRKCR